MNARMFSRRRRALLATTATLGVAARALGGAGLAAAGSAWAQPAQAEMTIEADRVLHPVNPLILGNNIDWTHSAQGMYREDSDALSPGYVALADRLAPTALRYPGGTNSDFYHWKNGVGPPAARPPTKTLEGKEERIKLGTDDFLALCARWKSEPLITVNIATGTAQEAADWVRYTNRRATNLPRVKYWEIGNEPYLEAHFPEAKVPPAEYADRANRFIAAMKAVDPAIQCGLVLRNDTLGGVSATPFKGYIDTVLAGVNEPFEFAALHSSYFPVTFEKKESAQDMYLATMAGTRVMQQDMEATRAKLRQYQPRRAVKLAITEYNALYSLDILRWGLPSVFLSRTDRYIESMAGALYVADALRLFSLTSDLLMANFWSICGNWWYGAIGHDGAPRPQFHVLEAYRDLARGTVVPSTIRTATMATPRSGFVPAMRDVPQLEGHAVRDGPVLAVALINKHPQASLALRLSVPALDRASVTIRELSAPDYFSREVRVRDRTAGLAAGKLDLTLPRHSFAVVKIKA